MARAISIRRVFIITDTYTRFETRATEALAMSRLVRSINAAVLNQARSDHLPIVATFERRK